MSESEEDGSVILDFDGVNSTTIHISQNPDAEYEGEWGYSLIKSLRGKSTGRRLKRKLFKFGFVLLVCGFALLIITIEAGKQFKNIKYFDTAPYGASLQSLLWCTSVPSFLMGFATMVAVRYWASLTTNRKLLCSLMRCYMVGHLLLFLFALWCTCVLFLEFSGIKDWGVTVTLASARPYYISTVIFIMPLLAVQVLYTLDVSYLVSEIDAGGNITEPDPPERVMDLSDVTLAQSCIFVCAMPCIVCVQLSDLVAAVARAYRRHYRDEPTLPQHGKKTKTTPMANKNRGFGRRVWKTVNRWFRGSRHKEVRPVAATAQSVELELVDLQKVDREQQEREERERVAREQEERRRVREFEEAAAQAELQRKQEEALLEVARALNARRLREEEEKRLREQQEAEAAKEAAEAWEPTMGVPAFKAVWSSLPTAGSFQCKLKVLPVLQALTDHLRRQGFHIVFAANPTPTDVEIGVCNVRKAAVETWFMARFLATPSSFSAVMKAQNAEQVTGYVKKFALAKVLKIDAAVGGK